MKAPHGHNIIFVSAHALQQSLQAFNSRAFGRQWRCHYITRRNFMPYHSEMYCESNKAIRLKQFRREGSSTDFC